ncbi:SGNH/GDSL hydrolase family protein [Streptomyces sp. NPDC006624]|uniref:SGNH/GDSL hydrolase family protein n=1 Tax=Streptomyces sp. NPDC006624 TaxID=3154892 RepID=UPI0033B33AE9
MPLPRMRTLIATAASLLLLGTSTGATAAAPDRDGGVSASVHTAGRVQDAGDVLRYSWPGVYFEGRVRGTGVGVVLDDPAADYDVSVDGTTVATLVTPGRTTHWIRGLRDGVHTVRLVKRNDTPWSTSSFGGFRAAPGGAVLAPPAARSRQIEFIGDSLTAGYGNLSASRDCDAEQLGRTTNADVGYGALTARRLGADHQINAYSGLGIVRNYGGGSPEVTYRTFYDRALLNEPDDVWHNPGTWRPRLVVVHLGTNDFSTPPGPDEPWTDESLAAAYRGAYSGFLEKLRSRYGPRTTLVAVGAGSFTGQVEQVVRERNGAGDRGVHHWPLDATGLDFTGCHWHYSARDHRLLADRLTAFLAGLPIRW